MEKVYAVVKNSVVINTIIFDDPSEELIAYFREEMYNADFIMDVDGDIYCAIGGTWDGSKFILPQPDPSWEYDDESRQWFPPFPSI